MVILSLLWPRLLQSHLFLSMAAVCHWPLYQLDIKNVFLHRDLEDEVYMEQPPSFVAQVESSKHGVHTTASILWAEAVSLSMV